MTTRGLLHTLREGLRAAAEPGRAPQMQAYMKSAMPYHGVPAPAARAVFKRVFAEHALESPASWQKDVLALWRGAEFREERYGAIALTGDRRARPFQELAALPMYEEMIVTGAWWDYVDELAANRIGPLLAAHPREMKRAMLAYGKDPDMWKQRTSILAQLRFRGDTDTELLAACIEPSIASTEFFLRKAIGWALREFSGTDAAWVVRYVKEHESALSGLSKREALRKLGPQVGAREARRT